MRLRRSIAEAYAAHNDVSRKVARRRAIEMLDRVAIPQAAVRVDSYPHEFSGGMRPEGYDRDGRCVVTRAC